VIVWLIGRGGELILRRGQEAKVVIYLCKDIKIRIKNW